MHVPNRENATLIRSGHSVVCKRSMTSMQKRDSVRSRRCPRALPVAGPQLKIVDIFQATQQIQLLVVARRLLGLSSTEAKWQVHCTPALFAIDCPVPSCRGIRRALDVAA